jgi:hypothetical protein
VHACKHGQMGMQGISKAARQAQSSTVHNTQFNVVTADPRKDPSTVLRSRIPSVCMGKLGYAGSGPRALTRILARAW